MGLPAPIATQVIQRDIHAEFMNTLATTLINPNNDFPKPLPVMEAIMSDALAPTPYALDHIVLPAKG